jgi:hypothetical protein
MSYLITHFAAVQGWQESTTYESTLAGYKSQNHSFFPVTVLTFVVIKLDLRCHKTIKTTKENIEIEVWKSE